MKARFCSKAIKAIALLIAAATLSLAGDESLLIGPGDLLHIRVFDTPEMEQTVRVTDAGAVPLLFIGDTKVAGITPAQASRLVEQELVSKQIMRHPQVNVTVEQYATQNVSVLGQVHAPGTYPITTAMPVTRILSLAGGITDMADRHIVIERAGKPNETVNYFFSNNATEAFAAAPLVYPGDTITVPKAGFVYVLGDVGHPGGYPISTNDSQMSLLQAMASAGSLNKTSTKSKVVLIRKTPNGTEQIPLKMAAIEKGSAKDIELRPDDVIYVPFSWMKNVALNAGAIAASTAGAAIYAVR